MARALPGAPSQSAQACAWLRATLATDPGLAVWSLIAACRSFDNLVASVSEATRWLLEEGGQRLADSLRANERAVERARAYPLATRAAFAVETAALARGLAESIAPSSAEEAYWLGLVAAWSLPNPRITTADASAAPGLPTGLHRRIVQAAAAPASNLAPHDFVGQALGWLVGREAPSCQVRDLWRGIAPLAAETQRQCLADSPAARAELAACGRVSEAGKGGPPLPPAPWAGAPAPVELAAARSVEQDRLDALAEFAAGAGHEMNNPLAIVAGRAQLLMRSETDPERRRELAVIHTQAMRVHGMLADLMLFARPPVPELERVDLRQLVETAVAETAAEAAQRGADLQVHLPLEAHWVDADPGQMAVAVKAILENSLYALGRGGVVRVAVGADRTGAAVSIADSGPGVSPEVRARMFDPFYSGRPAGRGLGMGLAKCWRIVRMHGGRIDVVSEPGQGATVTLSLPRAV